jgi:hypothetical protein
VISTIASRPLSAISFSISRLFACLFAIMHGHHPAPRAL